MTTAADRSIFNKVVKDRVTFLRRADASGATVVQVELAPGGGVPLHFHPDFAEHFTCLHGVLGLEIDGEVLHLQPGKFATAPVRSRHRFFNPTPERVVFRVELTPGHVGFERGLIIGYGLANDDATNARGIPKNPLHMALLFDMSGTRLPGGAAAMTPLLRLLAWIGRRAGIERELVGRYDPERA